MAGSKRIKDNLSLLRKLRRCKAKQRRLLLAQGGKPLQLCLMECIINILKGNVPLSKAQKSRLYKHRKDLRLLSKKNTSLKKRLAVEQKGGFLGAIIAPILGGVLGALLRKKQ